MGRKGMLITFFVSMCAMSAPGQESFQSDLFRTSEGELKITFLGHGSLMLTFGGRVIQIDPYSKLADYSRLPKADIILITHEHGDHLDAEALGQARSSATKIVTTETVAKQVAGAIVMKNGDSTTVDGLRIEAVAAYNIVNKRGGGEPFHPKGVGNGYLLAFGDKRVYIAGDTENTPEMKALEGVDIAFLPMNLPYTMTPEMVADAARAFRPKVLYPYHFSGTDPALLTALLADETGIEVRVRRLE